MTLKLQPLDMAAERKKSGYTPRIIANVQGIQKHGKTHFTLSAPKYLYYMNFDKSSEEDVMPKFDGQNIVKENYWPEDLTLEAGKVVWDRFVHNFGEALVTPEIRTIVIDTFTEVRNVALQKEYGKATQVGNKFLFGAPHQELRNLINRVYPTNKNLILVHKEKKEYVNDSWSGGYELQGFGDTPFLVQTNLHLTREKDKEGLYHFKCTVLDCSINIDIIGAELTDESCNFPTLATLIFPDTELSDWE
jgi:hypothetical protein